MNLMKKECKFVWSKECEEAFQMLKERLNTAPVLTLLDSSKEYQIYSNDSKNGSGYVLM